MVIDEFGVRVRDRVRCFVVTGGHKGVLETGFGLGLNVGLGLEHLGLGTC